MSSSTASLPDDDPILREALKRCSPATYYAACKFRATGNATQLRLVVLGVVERFVERDRRGLLGSPSADTAALRLSEDLGLDSLTMMEVVMLAEEVLGITISNEELTRLRTLGAVMLFIEGKAARPGSATAMSGSARSALNPWDLSNVGDEVRQIESRAAAPLVPLVDQRPTAA